MTREGPMDGDLERRVGALEKSHLETATALDRLLELSSKADAKLASIDAKLDSKASAAAVDAKFAAMDMKLAVLDGKLAVMDAKLDGKATAADVAAIGAKLDAKASIADIAAVSAKLDSKANVADVAKYEPLVKAVADLVIDIRTLRDNARTDYRVLFGAIITAALGLAALMAKGFHWV